MLWRREKEGHALAPRPEPAPGHRAGLKPFGGRLEKLFLLSDLILSASTACYQY